jgi:polyhydroxyalkanoate synthesis regulator phasin
MTKQKLDQIVKELVADGRHPDDEAFDIADGVLYDEEGMSEAITKHYRATDTQGWLANKIS